MSGEETDNTVIETDAIGSFFWNTVHRRKGPVFENAYMDALRGSDWGEDTVDGVGADTFQSLFQLMPEIRDDLPDHLNPLAQVMSEALGAPEMEALRNRTRMNQSKTLLAWQSMFPDFLKKLSDIMDEPEPEGGDGEGDGDDDSDNDGDEDGGGDGQGDGDEDGDEDGDGSGETEGNGGGQGQLSEQQKADIRQALAEAANDADKQVEAFEKAWGSEEKEFLNLSVDAQLKMAERVAADPEFAEIMMMAGNLERMAQSSKQEKATDVPQERVDVEFGRNLSRMTSMERMRASDPTGKHHPAMKLMALEWGTRLVDNRVLQWEMKGIEEVNRGPVVICVDVSGSMQGRDNVVAKALTVAACKVARKDERAVRVVLFSNSAEIYDSPKDYNDAEAYLKFLDNVATRFSGGGTNFDDALEKAMPAFETGTDYEDADLIFITDGAANISSDVEEMVKESKERNEWTMYSIFTSGGYSDTLDEITDTKWTVNSMNDGVCLEVLEGVI